MARCGIPLVAARGGRVQWKAYQASGAGYYLVIDGKRTGHDWMYAHLRRRSHLRKGQVVRTGQRIGVVGQTGDATACHLHVEEWSAPGWYEGGHFLNAITRHLRSGIAGASRPGHPRAGAGALNHLARLGLAGAFAGLIALAAARPRKLRLAAAQGHRHPMPRGLRRPPEGSRRIEGAAGRPPARPSDRGRLPRPVGARARHADRGRPSPGGGRRPAPRSHKPSAAGRLRRAGDGRAPRSAGRSCPQAPGAGETSTCLAPGCGPTRRSSTPTAASGSAIASAPAAPWT